MNMFRSLNNVNGLGWVVDAKVRPLLRRDESCSDKVCEERLKILIVSAFFLSLFLST